MPVSTVINGTTSSSFKIPASYNTSYGASNTLVFSGAIQPIVATGTYTITTSGTPAPGATVTITITNQTADTPPVPVNFEKITFQATFTGTVAVWILLLNLVRTMISAGSMLTSCISMPSFATAVGF